MKLCANAETTLTTFLVLLVIAFELELIAPTATYEIDDTEKQTSLQMEENVTAASLSSESERKRNDKHLPIWLNLVGHIGILIAFIILIHYYVLTSRCNIS